MTTIFKEIPEGNPPEGFVYIRTFLQPLDSQGKPLDIEYNIEHKQMSIAEYEEYKRSRQ